MTETDSSIPHDTTRHCGARTRSGLDCRRPAGWGTAHVGRGRCKLHGGVSGTVRHGIYSRYAAGRTGEILAALGDVDAGDAAPEIRLGMAALAAQVERLGPETDAEAVSALSLAISRLTMSKQRQRRLEESLTREEFGDYLNRLFGVVRSHVPAEQWADCERAMARVPVLLDGEIEPGAPE